MPLSKFCLGFILSFEQTCRASSGQSRLAAWQPVSEAVPLGRGSSGTQGLDIGQQRLDARMIEVIRYTEFMSSPVIRAESHALSTTPEVREDVARTIAAYRPVVRYGVLAGSLARCRATCDAQQLTQPLVRQAHFSRTTPTGSMQWHLPRCPN